jgi:cell division cycle 2-like protein
LLSGTPTEKVWPGFQNLPVCQKVKFVDFPSGLQQLRAKFPHAMLSDLGMQLLRRFLTFDPKERISCEEALKAPYFDESPRAISPSMFPTWPAKSEVSAADKAKKAASPKPPSGGGAYKKINEDDLEALAEAAAADTGGFSFVARNKTSVLPQWNLKF